jgi:hypothetical protein
MKDMTVGTFIACMFLCFMIGFVTCHEIYGGMEKRYAKDILGSNNGFGNDTNKRH